MYASRFWSEREDSNLRPPQPHCGALPGCATLRNLTQILSFKLLKINKLDSKTVKTQYQELHKDKIFVGVKFLDFSCLVGARGFEPPTPTTPL